MLRPRLPRIGRALKTPHRSLHKVPLLTHDFSNGVPGLLSPAGFNIAWTQYQSLMVEKLNTLTDGKYAQFTFKSLNGSAKPVMEHVLSTASLPVSLGNMSSASAAPIAASSIETPKTLTLLTTTRRTGRIPRHQENSYQIRPRPHRSTPFQLRLHGPQQQLLLLLPLTAHRTHALRAPK